MSGHTRLGRLVTGVIILNVGVTAWALLDHTHEEITETIELGCLAFYGMEMATKVWVQRASFFRSRGNLFDLGVVLLAALPVLGDGWGILRMARLARFLHLGKHLTGLRLFAIEESQRVYLRMRLHYSPLSWLAFYRLSGME